MDYPKIHMMEQGSDEWYAARLGHVTASNFGTAIAKPGSTRSTLMRRLVAERLTGLPQGTYKNANMERGNELEPQAREYYESLNDCVVKEVGFIECSEHVGVSPDGLVGEDGGIEIKAPLPSTHIDYIVKDREVAVYRPQIQGLMWATGRKWVDFVSFCPEVTNRQYWSKRILRDEQYIAELEVKISIFITEMLKMIDKVNVSQF